MDGRGSTDLNKYTGNSSARMNNFSDVHNQTAEQTIQGNVFHGPVYSTTVTNDQGSYQGPYQGSRHGFIAVGDPLHRRQQCLSSLKFASMDVRRDTIRAAHTSTCQWLLESPTLRRWLQDDMLLEHNGFLWIKGKPGTGKSTILKFVMAHMKNTVGCSVVSFFFNARGDILERSTVGMYRSILVRILEIYPDLQSILDTCAVEDTMICWTVEILQDLLRNVIQRLGTRDLTCFVDALDECEEDETRDMVSFFEELGRFATSSGTRFRTLFSSRHYPHITMDRSLILVLENQQGHSDDLNAYLASELKIGHHAQAQDIKQELISKSSGIFLWLVLVVRILNKEFDRGRVHMLRQQLEELPGDLEELLHGVVTRDGQPGMEMALCIQWVLFARRPLQPHELYCAILVGTTPEYLDSWDPSTVTKDDMARFLLHVSKGLIEETRSRVNSTMQFIHESVRNFFLNEHRLQKLSFLGPFRTLSVRSHDCLKQLCLDTYTKASAMAHSQQSSESFSTPPTKKVKVLMRLQRKEQLQQTFPLLSYSIRNVLYHSELAHQLGSPQEAFLRAFDIRHWSYMNCLIHGSHSYSPEVSLLYVLAAEDLSCLLTCEIKNVSTIDIPGEQHHYPLFAAQANRCSRSLYILLSPWSSRGDAYDQFDSYVRVTSADVEKAVDTLMKMEIVAKGEYTPLGWSFENGHADVLNCLLKGGLSDMTLLCRNSCHLINSDVQTPLSKQLSNRMLTGKAPLSQSPGVNVSLKILMHDPIILWWTIRCKLYGLLKWLLDQPNFDVNQYLRLSDYTLSCTGLTILHFALRSCDKTTVDLILRQKNINVNKKSKAGISPLEQAICEEAPLDIVSQLLRHEGIDPNEPDHQGRTALHRAASIGNLMLAELLLEHPVIQANGLDRRGRTPLQEAIRFGHSEIVEHLCLRLHVSLIISTKFPSGRHPSSINGDTVDIEDSVGGSFVYVYRSDDAPIPREYEDLSFFLDASTSAQSAFGTCVPRFACDKPHCNRKGNNAFIRVENLKIHQQWHQDFDID